MKTILISGGSDGLGRALASSLALKYNVVILGRNAEKTVKAAEEICSDYVVADVKNHLEVTEAVNKVINKYGQIDVLVNNAGTWIQGKLEDNKPEQLVEVIAVNVTGMMLLTRAVLPYMKEKGHGRIINVGSQASFSSKPERSVYNASKWAVAGFTKTIGEELTGSGVAVTGFYPGAMKTSLFAKANIEKDMSKFMELDEVVRALHFIIETPDHLIIPEFGIRPSF